MTSRNDGGPVLIQNGKRYVLHSYTTEAELENCASMYIKEIFGINTLFIDSKRKMRSVKGIAGIPDGFIVDTDNKKFYILEVELSRHSIIRHITEQLFRFKVAMNNPATKDMLAESISTYGERAELKISKGDIKSMVSGFGIIILIDDVSEQLLEVVKVLAQDGTDVLAIPFETYRHKGESIYKFTAFSQSTLERESKKWTFKWSTVPIEQHLKKTNEKSEKLFKALSEKICSIPGVVQKSRRNWVTFQTSPLKNFCTVKIYPEFLEISLKADEHFTDPKGLTEKIKRTPAWTFDRVMKIKDESEITPAIELIQQSYICTCG